MMVLSLFAATSMMAQWGNGQSSSTTVYYYDQDDYSNHNNNYYYDDYNDYDNYNDRRHSPFRSYRRVDHLYHRMTKRDRKCLRGLERKLGDRKRKAWEDGHLSDRDLRRVRDVERDISRLYAKYSYSSGRYRNNGSYHNYGNSNYSYRVNRNNRSCR